MHNSVNLLSFQQTTLVSTAEAWRGLLNLPNLIFDEKSMPSFPLGEIDTCGRLVLVSTGTLADG